MKELQHALSFPVGPARDRSKTKTTERRLQILGRPRRLRPTFSMSPWLWRNVYSKLSSGLTPEEACSEHASEPAIIKISIEPPILSALDRIRKKIEGNATYPDLIRIAVAKFVEKPYPESKNTSKEGGVVEKPSRKNGRCKYLKVLFTPDILEKIGHQGQSYSIPNSSEYGVDDPTGLCKTLNKTRQQVINMAILEYLKGVG